MLLTRRTTCVPRRNVVGGGDKNVPRACVRARIVVAVVVILVLALALVLAVERRITAFLAVKHVGGAADCHRCELRCRRCEVD